MADTGPDSGKAPGRIERFVNRLRRRAVDGEDDMLDLDFGPNQAPDDELVEAIRRRRRYIRMGVWVAVALSLVFLIYLIRDPYYAVGKYHVYQVEPPVPVKAVERIVPTPQEIERGDQGDAETEETVRVEYVNGIVKNIPDEALLRWGREGQVPRIGDDERLPREVYGRKFVKPRGMQMVSIVVGELGLNSKDTKKAIDQLPPEVSLAFKTSSEGMDIWFRRAWARGHETLIDLPMEPVGYPSNDPGPYTLLTSALDEQNDLRLEWAMSRGMGYVGLVNTVGNRFAENAQVLRPMFHRIREHGLLFLEASDAKRRATGAAAASTGIAYGETMLQLDSYASREVVREKLEELTQAALQTGRAIGYSSSTPVVIEEIKAWSRTLPSRGVVLAPVSAIVVEGG